MSVHFCAHVQITRVQVNGIFGYLGKITSSSTVANFCHFLKMMKQLTIR